MSPFRSKADREGYVSSEDIKLVEEALRSQAAAKAERWKRFSSFTAEHDALTFVVGTMGVAFTGIAAVLFVYAHLFVPPRTACVERVEKFLPSAATTQAVDCFGGTVSFVQTPGFDVLGVCKCPGAK